MQGLYVHLPFCRQKCHYCDFRTVAHGEKRIDAYMEALTRELRFTAQHFHTKEWTTLYLGGGTPSFVPVKKLKIWMDTFYRYYPKVESEVTLEANPEDITKENIREWKSMGINRISIGLQSTDEKMVKKCGRAFISDWKERIRWLREEGILNFSLDLLLALPGQRMQDVEKMTDQILDIKPPHLSVYSLILEEKTYFGYLARQGKLLLPDEDLERDLVHYVTERLKNAGYNHYELSNFALPGYEAIHNSFYWERIPYLGLGLGAASHWEELRWKNSDSLQRYLKLAGTEKLWEDKEKIGMVEAMSEALILGLRKIDGVEISRLKNRYDEKIFEEFKRDIRKNIQRGILERHGDRLRLSPKGIDLGDIANRDFFR